MALADVILESARRQRESEMLDAQRGMQNFLAGVGGLGELLDTLRRRKIARQLIEDLRREELGRSIDNLLQPKPQPSRSGVPLSFGLGIEEGDLLGTGGEEGMFG
jgi:hypothetical protein